MQRANTGRRGWRSAVKQAAVKLLRSSWHFELGPSGAKAQISSSAYAARLKSCPDKRPLRIPAEPCFSAAWKIAAFAALWPAASLMAQVSSYSDKETGPVNDKPPSILNGVGIAQNLNTQLPLSLTFTDDQGQQVPLGSYFGRKPAILALVYYQCPML